VDIIALEEHWLTTNKLHLLNEVHPDFTRFGISPMSDRLASAVYYGRPYGGVGFLWRKKFARNYIGYKARSGRILSMMLRLNDGKRLNIVSVYFPCFANSCEYIAELSECLSDIEVLSDGAEAIIVSDTNFECDLCNDGCRQCFSLLNSYNIRHCVGFVTTKNPITYCNDALGHCSFIDHMFVSDSLTKNIASGIIFDSGANLSDHLPLIYLFKFDVGVQVTKSGAANISAKYYTWRWDKTDLSYFYDCSYQNITNLVVPYPYEHCDLGCRDASHLCAVSAYYESIVHALQSASHSAIPRVPYHSLKPFWNDELDRLKDDSVFWHDIWVSAGRPRTGTLQHIRLSYFTFKAKYKLGIRHAYKL